MVLNQKTGKEREISTINEVQFGILSPEEILNRSVAHINEPNLYDSSGNPRYNGLFDPRMGVIERKRQCLTCKQSYVECPGHFGHIELAKPLYHMQYIVQIRKILDCVCNHCGKLLIEKNNVVIEEALSKNPEDRLDFIRLKIKTKICGLFLVGKNKTSESEELHGCGFEKPTKIGSKDFNHVQVEYIKEVKNEETGDVTKEVIEQPYTPDMVLSIFKRISPEDALILGFSKDWCLPHWLIYTVLAVVPPSVRPSVRLHNSQRSEDDITHKYNDIIKQNNQLSEFIKNGESEELIRDYHHLIQCHVATLVDNNSKGVISEAKHRTGRPLKTFKQRLHGKEGRIRSNLMGKRVDFSARSVISPDASLDIDQLGVPIKIAMNLTYPEIVNKYNINNLYKLVRNGSKVYPGSNSYTNTEEGMTKTFEHIDTSKIVLKYGDIVNRHLIDGDIVLFNRQPSLHKMSMMAHSIKITTSKTFRFNVDVCSPYNADFDGDEMNMHVPQSIQAAAELRYLASVRKQIISPSTNSPIIQPSQDNLLGLYKITEDNVFFTHREVMNLMAKVKAFKGSLPPPAISDGKKIRWSGKQLISMILPPISITISNKKAKCQITRGQIISGRINKTVSNIIVHVIFSEYGFDEAARYMNDLQRIIKGYMVRSGFSIGMSDLIVHKDIRKKNEEYILDTKKDVIDMTKKVHLNIFENITKNIEGVYEAMITKRLSETTTRIESETTANISEENNRVKYMVASGSKGNATNIMQMMCLVGQQIIDGKRIPLGFSDRSLPHFLRYDNGVESKGFVVNNYLDGLTPTEFFFHAEGGREGLIDTAVKTARSGYLQRKLVKTMEDLKVEHDYTVRNSSNKIVQFIYGNDAFNPIYLQNQMIDNLVVPEDEILEDKYLMDSKEKWDKYMTSKSVSEMKKDNYQNKVREYNEYLNNMIVSINELHQQSVNVNKTAEKHRDVLFPVNFDSLLRNIKDIYHLDGKGKSDVSPFEIMDMYKQLYKTAYKNVKTDNRMFSVLMMEKLSPVYLIKYVRITKVALESMLNTILNKYKKALIQGGESVGPIAGQSIGELSTQLTLNSVDWETFMLFNINNSSVTTKIGEFIDDLLEKNKNNNKIKYIKENRTEYLELDDDINIKVPSIDCGDKKSGGHMNWCKVSAITRHLPVGDLVKIKTESGREVIATQQKSFLIWNKDRITTTNGSDLKIGDKIPVNKNMNCCNINNEFKLCKYLPKNKYLYGTDYNKCGELFDADNRKRKFGFFKGHQNISFTIPYSRLDSFVDTWKGKKLKKTIIEKGYIYPKKICKTISKIPDTWELNEELGFIVGIYLSEGWTTNTFMGISNNEDNILQKVRDWCDKINVSYHLVISTNKNFIGSKSSDLKIHSVVLARFFKIWLGTGSSNKKIPDEAYNSNLDFVKGIIDGYISGDGTINKKDGSIVVSSSSKKLLIGISVLLTKYNIFSKISGHTIKKNNVNSKNIKYCNILTIRNGFAQLFAEKIGSTHKDKLLKLNTITKLKKYKSYNGKYHSMNDVILDKIVSIDYVKPTHQYVYDLTVPDTLNFGILNGIQMRDTFHLAGVGSKSSVNQGVPRLEELLSQNRPKNPSLKIFLKGEYALDSDKADQVCYNIEIVKIKDIIKSDAIYFEPSNDLSDVLEEDKDIMKLYQVFTELDSQSANIPNNPWIIRLEFNRHNMLEKKITMSDINLILKHHLPKSNIVFADDNSGKLIFRIRFDFDSNVNQADDDISHLNEQIEYIKNITIKGVDDILEAYKIENNNKIVKDGDKYISQKEYMIETSGSNLFDILCKSYVDSSRTYSINVSEMYETFGIEAARWILEKEIIQVFEMSNAITNARHIKLLCDLMTNRGTIMTANRIGINQSDNEIGPLAKSSFEETIGQLTMAGLYGISDKLKGVSSNIMVGQISKCGTGYSEILLDEDKLQDIEDDEDNAYSHVDYQDNIDNVNKLFDSSDYCVDNNMIQFNIGNIDSDEINLDNISIPINI